MNGLNYLNVSQALINEAHNLRDYAQEVSPRGQLTKEFINCSFTIVKPNQRHILVSQRWANPFASIAETLWTLAGRNDLDWLERYIPQCKKWSDDGKTWRAAYGPRLRNINPSNYLDSQNYTKFRPGVDQIKYVTDKLRGDRDSRQAVVTLWDPSNDTIPDSKDYPCNNWLQFLIRDGKLHLSVVLRSNDLIYGFSHNDFYLWSVLQELVANCLNVEVGTMTWFAGSFHVYERHFRLLETMEPIEIPIDMKYIPIDVHSLEDFDKLCSDFFACLSQIYTIDLSDKLVEVNYKFLLRRSNWFASMYLMMVAHEIKQRHGTILDIFMMLEQYIGNTDLFYSTMLYLFKDDYYTLMAPYIESLAV